MARQCSECGSEKAATPFKGRTIVVAHAGLKRSVTGLAGWECAKCGEVIFDPVSARRYAAAGDALVLEDRVQQSVELKTYQTEVGPDPAPGLDLDWWRT